MTTTFDPHAMLAVLERHGVECVVIGGYAANLYGATRPTYDLDVTPNRTRENLTRLTAALVELQARIRVAGIPEGVPFNTNADALAGLSVLNLVTRHGDLDISMVPGGTDGYDDLIVKAIRHQIGHTQATVADLDDVIRSKTAADRPKDREALPELRDLQATRERLRLAVQKPDDPTPRPQPRQSGTSRAKPTGKRTPPSPFPSPRRDNPPRHNPPGLGR